MPFRLTTEDVDDDEAGQEERTWTTMTAVEVWEEDVGGGRNSQPRGGCRERSHPTTSTMAVVVREMTTSNRNDNDVLIINKAVHSSRGSQVRVPLVLEHDDIIVSPYRSMVSVLSVVDYCDYHSPLPMMHAAGFHLGHVKSIPKLFQAMLKPRLVDS